VLWEGETSHPHGARGRPNSRSRVMYSRAFFIRALAFLNYPRVYSREFNDLRVLSTSGCPWFSQHGNRVRNPHRQRVAIKRHEFLEKSTVASATTSFVANRSSVQTTVSSSLLAPLRGVTVCSAVAVATREPRDMRVDAFHDTIGVRCLARISPVLRERIVRPCYARSVVRGALLLPGPRRSSTRTSTYATPLETV